MGGSAPHTPTPTPRADGSGLFLKSLTLKGFKSFSETTRLDFEPGVTVVVGPNGSGKSNVVDAIAWVLGAQGPTTVRSSRMDDVIFAGTTKRPAFGRAEVTLTIDNSSGILPIEFTDVTVRRTLFRDGDSEYSLNGVPCRLLDITELLSDTGVGRQQHLIVAQGQIDHVLSAKPEERRLMIEEAAGVLKYRRRKERSERRLASTEANLVRLSDLLREVRRQIRPLEKQAEAARRHDDLVAELHALRLHISGRELISLRRKLVAVDDRRVGLAADEAELRATISEVDAAVIAAESRLASAGQSDLGDALTRQEALRERARGLAAVLVERRRTAIVERDARIAADVVEAVEAELANAVAELAVVDTSIRDLEPVLATDEEKAVGTRAAEARGERAALHTTVAQLEAERHRASARIESTATRLRRADESVERLTVDLGALARAGGELAGAADRQRVQVNRRTTDVEMAERQAQRLDVDLQSWRARADALEGALDAARTKAGAAAVAHVDGVVGPLAELVEIDPGWAKAFEAAAGDAMAAVVVADQASGRRALDALAEAGEAGAVLPADAGIEPAAISPVGERLRPRVRSTDPRLGRLLDVISARAVVVEGTWREAVDVALAHPELVVVTKDGDRFGPAGWRVGAGGTGATGAALEESVIKGGALELELADAEAAAGQARRALAAVQAELADLLDKIASHDAEQARAEAELAAVQSERRDCQTETDAVSRSTDELDQRANEVNRRLEELERVLASLEQQERLELDAASERASIGMRHAALVERRSVIAARHDELESRLTAHGRDRGEAIERRARLDLQVAATDALAAVVAEATVALDAEVEQLRRRRRALSDEVRVVAETLDDARQRRTGAEKRLDEARELLGRAEIEHAEVTLRVETMTETIRTDLDATPDEAEATSCPALAEGASPRGRARELDRELRRIGPINPLARQEHEELQERVEFLEEQMADVRSSRRELRKVIRAIDDEIARVFASAYADVSENFEQLFATLFPGGSGALRLTTPDDLLETGIELEARPSGKNVRKLSLLSGGERSLTALAFLFAIFRSCPSPFYVMDEVEAALDDVNLHRFLDLVAEFRNEAQLVLVSHQKRTMDAADCLYGVSMQAGGSSKVISERVTAA